MAARYVDTANIVAQGQSFYTGLLPGSYEKGGGGGGSNAPPILISIAPTAGPTAGNTTVTITDTRGDTLCWASGGTCGF